MQADTYKQTGLLTMPSLSRQQIIILVVMVLTILYGAYTFFPLFSRKIVSGITGKKDEDLKTFITGLNSDLSKSNPSATDAYVINRAGTEWRRDPFIFKDGTVPSATTGESGKKVVVSGQFIYTGYVETGNKKMAIINGFEYGVGDSMEKAGFILEGIFPDRVIIRNQNNSARIEVHLKKSGEDIF
ncbi:MAG: hypothetical protein PH343_02285 [Nitrospira sp.]|nr:hypothetical protein [Nitrospira sp.]